MRRVLLALIAIGVLVILGTRGSASSGKEKGHLVKHAAQGTLQAAGGRGDQLQPGRPTNLVAGQNDSRVGFNQCGIDWSTDNGHKWCDLLPPFRQKVNNPPARSLWLAIRTVTRSTRVRGPATPT